MSRRVERGLGGNPTLEERQQPGSLMRARESRTNLDIVPRLPSFHNF